jgi:hypothetical protein
VTAREQYDRGYDAGNYDAAYAPQPYHVALRARQRAGTRTAPAGRPYTHGYTMGYFSSYAPEEVPAYACEAYAAARAYAHGTHGASAAGPTRPAPRTTSGGGRLVRTGLGWGWAK